MTKSPRVKVLRSTVNCKVLQGYQRRETSCRPPIVLRFEKMLWKRKLWTWGHLVLHTKHFGLGASRRTGNKRLPLWVGSRRQYVYLQDVRISKPLRILMASTTSMPAIIAFVVAIAGIIFPRDEVTRRFTQYRNPPAISLILKPESNSMPNKLDLKLATVGMRGNKHNECCICVKKTRKEKSSF